MPILHSFRPVKCFDLLLVPFHFIVIGYLLILDYWPDKGKET